MRFGRVVKDWRTSQGHLSSRSRSRVRDWRFGAEVLMVAIEDEESIGACRSSVEDSD